MQNVEITLCRSTNTYLYQTKDSSGLHPWIFLILSPVISKTKCLKLLQNLDINILYTMFDIGTRCNLFSPFVILD